MSALDLSGRRRIHIVGVGGAGMSGLATVLAAMGHDVSGSDRKASGVLDRLEALGVRTFVGHAGDHLGAAEVVACSTAIGDDNPEVLEARTRGLPVLRRAELLGAVTALRRTAAVSGTAGKTTTSSMLATVLLEAGADPSVLVGGDVHALGSGARWGAGDWLVVEADESDGTFVEIHRDAVIVTNIEPDHLDHWGSFDALVDAFDRFVAGTEGPRVIGLDDAVAAQVARRHASTTFGTAAGADFVITDVHPEGAGMRFAVTRDGQRVGVFGVPVPGRHNVLNATAALVCALEMGFTADTIGPALAGYRGVGRRFELRGTSHGVTFVDDYAHLPAKCAAALASAEQGRARHGHDGWMRVVAVFQPHRYSRTEALGPAFADSFVGADVLVITDIYGAGEAPRPGVTSAVIIDAVQTAHPGQRIVPVASLADAAEYLAGELRSGDLCLSLGAGDVTTLPDLVRERMGPG